MSNHFVLPKNEYKRNLDVLGAYITDIATYLSKISGDPFNQTIDYVRTQLKPNGKFALDDPQIVHLQREKNGDRSLKNDSTFLRYLADITMNRFVFAPNMTLYETPAIKQSLLAKYIDINLKKRKKYKHEMFVMEMEGNAPMQNYYDNLQNSCKIKNNSLSGAHASPSTVIFNRSSHSTLTTVCRAATSYGNAHNEKFIMGNRHYWSPDVVIANILYICRNTDMVMLHNAMDYFSLHYPTVDETMECITYSTKLYWRNPQAIEEIRLLVSKLDPLERAAFVYVEDFYHLAKHNPEQIRKFIKQLIQVADTPHPDPESVFKSITGDMKTYVSLLCSDIMAGRLLDKVKKEDPTGYAIVAATAVNANKVLDKYKLLIGGLWRTNTLPASIASIQSMVRRCVVVSDTDSTIFSTQHWTQWYVGKFDFSKDSYAVSYAITFITSQIVIHLLAQLSAHLGVVEDQLHRLSMKNEYFFPTFVVTSRAKHYYAFVSAREGNVFKMRKMEIKGVEMRSSNAPPEVNKRLDLYMQDLMQKVIDKTYLTLDEVFGPVAKIENEIIQDIQNGGFKYMRMLQIKDADSYVAGEDAAPYIHYKMWEEVFAPKYGNTTPPPYPVVKISVSLTKPKQVRAWLDNMQDRDVALRMENWLKANEKDKITMFMLPQEILEMRGIPQEIIPAINLRQLIYNVMSPFYLVLESMGFFMTNKNITRLVSDEYKPQT